MCILERKKETLEEKERQYKEYTYSQRSWSSSSKRCCPSLTFAIHWSKSITTDDDADADLPLLFFLSLLLIVQSIHYYRGEGVVSSEYRLNRSISSPAPNTIFDFRYSFFYFFLFFSFLNLFIFYFYQSMTRVEAEALLLYYTVPYSHIRGGGMVFFGGCLRVAAIILQYKIIKKILFQTCSKEGN